MQHKKILALLTFVALFIALCIPALASAKQKQDTESQDTGSQDAEGQDVGGVEKSSSKTYSKIYSLPLPLPTGRRAARSKGKNSQKSLGERAKRLEIEKKFPKNYALVQTFALPSIEDSKPVTDRKKFQKHAKLPDPFVKFNRAQFKSTRKFEKYFFRPLAKGWQKIPNIITTPIINFAKNLAQPKHFANALLQGNPLRAIQSLFSFTINSTIGFGGIINVAQGIGMPDSSEDFGQTLAVYGVKSGPYLFLIAPSTVRDTAGDIIDSFVINQFVNPAQYLIPYYGQGISIGLGMLVGFDAYGKALKQIQAVEQGAIDLYVTTRRFYAYKRALQILNIEQEKGQSGRNTRPARPASTQKNAQENAQENARENARENAEVKQNKAETQDPFAEIDEEEE